MGNLYHEKQSKFDSFKEHSIAFGIMDEVINEERLDTGVDINNISAPYQIPSMGGIEIFVGKQTRKHGPRIKVSNKSSSKSPFSSKSDYDPVYCIDEKKKKFGYGNHGNPNLKYSKSEKQEIEDFFCRNMDAIKKNWNGSITDKELVDQIQANEIAEYNKKKGDRE